MNILLIGHEGYLGRGLYSFLSKKNNVIGWGRKQDILSLNQEVIIKNKIDAVVNCATIADKANKTFKINDQSYKVNVAGMHNLVNALQDLDVKLVYISTKDVFGNCVKESDVVEKKDYYFLKRFIDDSQPFAPETAYSKTKLIGELISECVPKSIVIRLSTCYTDFDSSKGNWITSIIKNYLKGEKIRVNNKGKQVRDVLHVDDLGRLIQLFLDSNHYGKKINAGGGNSNLISILQFIRMLDPNIEIENMEGGDYGFAFNNHQAKELFGWSPQEVFKEKLPKIIENIKNTFYSIKNTEE
ncbi:MAG: NAD-dependent epimerase/dehydratase family protein [archaeon]